MLGLHGLRAAVVKLPGSLPRIIEPENGSPSGNLRHECTAHQALKVEHKVGLDVAQTRIPANGTEYSSEPAE
jgi:hypothetical protein